MTHRLPPGPATTNNATITLDYPTGWQADDLALAFIQYSSPSGTIATPSGWTRRFLNADSNQKLYVFSRRLAAGDSGSRAFTPSGGSSGDGIIGGIMCVFDYSINDPIGSFVFSSNGSSRDIGPISVPDVGNVVQGLVVVVGCRDSGGATASDLSGDNINWTEIIDWESGLGCQLAVDIGGWVVPVDTTPKTFTLSSGSGTGLGISFVVNLVQIVFSIDGVGNQIIAGRSPAIVTVSGHGSSSTPIPMSDRTGLILYPLTGVTQTPRYLEDNISFIDSLPFDGIIVEAREPMGSEPGAVIHPIDITDGIWNSALTRDNMIQVLSPLSGISFSNVRRLFIIVRAHGGLDFFDDWSGLASRFNTLAEIIAGLGIEGIYLDNGPRQGWNSYAAGIYSGTKSLSEYQDKAISRGILLMESLVDSFPSVKVIHAIGPYVSILGNSIYSDSLSGQDNLQGPFFVGFLSGRESGDIIDGAGGLEWTRSYSDFDTIYRWRNVTISTDDILPRNSFIPYTHRGNSWESNVLIGTSISDNPHTDPLKGFIATSSSIIRRTIPIAMRHSDSICVFEGIARSYIDQSSQNAEWISAITSGRNEYAARTSMYARPCRVVPRWEERALGHGVITPSPIVGYTVPMINVAQYSAIGEVSVAVASGFSGSMGSRSIAVAVPQGATLSMRPGVYPIVVPSGNNQKAGIPHPSISKGDSFFVSPSGSDSNDGLSPITPFLTLTKARTQARLSSFKTIKLMNGTYNITTPFGLGSSDANETWTAYSGHTPVLDGGGTTSYAIIITGNGITIDRLVIQNFADYGILVEGCSGFTATNNTITGINSNAFSRGAILCQSSTPGATIVHNTIENTGYAGIWVGAIGVGEDISNLNISSNRVTDTMQLIGDGGAIYVIDRNHSSTNINISGNIIGDRGPVSHTVGIYLDDDASNVTVQNNVVYGSSVYHVQYHGGDHNTIQNNIFDVTSVTYLGLYQSRPSTSYGMASNLFEYNIVWSSVTHTASLWQYNYTPNTALNSHDNGFDASIINKFTNSAQTITISFIDPSNHNYNQNTTSLSGFTLFDTTIAGAPI